MTGDPFPELSVQSFAACEVGPDARLVGAPVDADTIYLVLAGRLHLRLPSGDSTAGAGSMVLLAPGLQPGIAPAAEVATEVVATRERLAQRGGLLVFDAAEGGAGALRVLVGRVRGDLSGKLRPSADGKPLFADLRATPLARSAYAALKAELDEPNPGFPTFAATLMQACLVLFVRAIREADSGGLAPATAAGQRIAAVVAAIRARPADGYSIERLAKLAGMSRATFARQFARHVGASAMEFLLRVRLDEAAGMLRTTEAPIKQVATDAGFQSRSHFTRVFQAQFGLDPSRFRAATAGSAAHMAHSPPPLLDPAGASADQ